MSVVRIPVRFENMLENSATEFSRLLHQVDSDLLRFDYLRRLSEVQQSGVLAFITGTPGAGKTSAVYSASVFMPDKFEMVFSVPHSVALREIPSYLKANLPQRSSRSLLCLIDGREVSDDEVGVRQLMSYLNQLVRSRSDVLLCWPTSDPDWHEELRGIASRVGGSALSPSEADVEIDGPAPSDWPTILERVLIQSDMTLDDLGLSTDELGGAVSAANTIGDFMSAIARIMATRIDARIAAQALPQLVFVVTSGAEVVGEANRLRRAGSLMLKANELMAYSPRSREAKWWESRNQEPAQHLAYMTSLFRARLTTLTASSINYACSEFGTADLQAVLKTHGIRRKPTNGDTTFVFTDFYKFLSGTTPTELTSGQKGRASESTLSAHAAMQQRSRTHHKVINQAICALAERNVPSFKASLAEFEVRHATGEIVTDAVAPWNGESLYLEFHHLSVKQCKASNICQYIMEKLQYYSIAYNLIPR